MPSALAQVELSKLVVGPVEQQRLFVNIRGRKYVKVEGWELVGAMKSVFASIVWTRPNESGDGYVARAEARWLDGNVPDGRLVGAGEAECSRAESTWKDRPAYSLPSMAQTRAISRALRGPPGPVFVLADYEMVGPEEMIATDQAGAQVEKDKPPVPSTPSDELAARISELIVELQDRDDRDWGAWCRDYAGVESFNELDEAGAARLVNGLERVLAERVEPDVRA